MKCEREYEDNYNTGPVFSMGLSFILYTRERRAVQQSFLQIRSKFTIKKIIF